MGSTVRGNGEGSWARGFDPKTPDTAQAEAARRAAEQERIERAAVAARITAYEKEKRDQEAAARRNDREADQDKEAQATREWNARQAAGIGYKLMAHTGISGASGDLIYVENVIDCALKYTEIGCETFAFSSLGTNRHVCNRHRGPVTLSANDVYTVGKRTAAERKEANNGSFVTDASAAPILTAQADPVPAGDDLTQCANGPFKVSGFKLLCDKLIAGGGSPGSNRERYVVTNINACASYCRQAAHCSGFAYHASQPGKQHDCQILGRGFITNDGGGWVSGVR